MNVRSSSVKVTKVLRSGYVIMSKKQFQERKLPTKKDVIERVLREDNFFFKSAAGFIAKELIDHWIWCNVYPVHESTVKDKIFNLIKIFISIDRYSKKKTKTWRFISEKRG